MTMTARWRRRVHYCFVTLVVVLGSAALVDAVWTLNTAPITNQWVLLAALALVGGAFAVKVPALNATLSISEAFLFALVLLFGPAPAVIAVAIDGLVVSLIRQRRHVRHVLFNFAEPALSIWLAAKVYFLLAGVPPLHDAPVTVTLTDVGLPSLALSGVYFVMNSVLNALAMATESGTSPFTMWRKYFLWVSLNYFGGASIAVLLAVNTRSMSLSSLLAIAPLILVSYFTFKSSMGRLEDENVHLAEVNKLYLKVVETLAMAVDAKDQVTHGHVRRVQTFALKLARRLDVNDSNELKAIEAAALLHDMGKLAVPEYILNKPGRLTPAEYDRMKLHAPLGADMLSAVGFPYPVVPIVRHHHENWDGAGYPDGIAGEAIPIGARILAVVDCYDALRSDRPYRRALTPDQALEIVKQRRGSMYDPAVVDAFESIRWEIEEENVDEPLPDVLERFAKAARETRHTEERTEVLPLEVRLQVTDALLHLYDHLGRLDRDASLEDTCDVVGRYVRRIVPTGLVVFYTLDERSEYLRVAHASGFGETALAGVTMPMGHGISGWVAANLQSVVNADPALDVQDRFAQLAPTFQSVLSVPLVADRSAIGALSLYSIQARAFNDVQRRAVELMGAAVGDTIAAAAGRQAFSLAAAASGPANGRALELLLGRDSFLGAGSGRPMGVMYLRCLDGAEAMAHASVAVNQATRVADLIVRLQANELVVLMPDCDATAGQIVTSRLADALAAMPDGGRIRDAVRLGFACSPYDGTLVRDLLDVSRRRLEAGDASPWSPDPREVRHQKGGAA